LKKKSTIKLNRETLRRLETSALPAIAGGQLKASTPTVCDPNSGCFPTCALTCENCTA
jgi:hypothetical protein